MHLFDPNVAATYGIPEAVIIQHFQFWINNNKRNDRNENEGRTWTYNSTKALAESFPYLSEKQIWTAINHLVDAGVLMKGNFNSHKYDRTLWYAFTLEDFWIRPEGDFHFPKPENADHQQGGPIPDTPSDVKPAGGPDTRSRASATRPAAKKKPEKKKAPGPPPAPDKDWQRWIDRYEVHVKAHNDGIGHNWQDRSQLGENGLKGIRQHLVKVSTRVEGKSDDDCGYGAWDYILTNWENLHDDFLQRQFDLTVIRKKITDIINRLKTNGSTNSKSATSGGGKAGHSARREEAIREY